MRACRRFDGRSDCELASAVEIGSMMSTHHVLGEPTGKRNIPAGLIDEARQYVYQAAIRTPLVRLNYDGPAEIYLKLECLQPIGSFKIRGAYNAVRLLPEVQRRRGVWTVSAGNAAQGVALAAQKMGVAWGLRTPSSNCWAYARNQIANTFCELHDFAFSAKLEIDRIRAQRGMVDCIF